MKKFLAVAVVIIIFAATLAGCTNTAYEKLLGTVWNSHEKFTYDVSVEGSADVGTYVYEIITIKNQDIVVGELSFTALANGHLIKNTLNYGSDSITETVLFGAASSLENMAPYASYRKSVIGGQITEYQVDYSATTASSSYRTYAATDVAPEYKVSEVELKAPFYDNGQLYTILRSLGEQSTFTLFTLLPAEADMAELICNSSESSTVTVPYGDINCYSYVIYRQGKLTGTSIYAYFSSNALTVGESSVSTVPVKIVEDKVTYSLRTIQL